MLFVIAVALILGWKVAGYFGADYFLLRWIGTPWHGQPVAAVKSAKAVYQESSAD
jgi:thiosulfate dehydrogenase [quinone] large subunit